MRNPLFLLPRERKKKSRRKGRDRRQGKVPVCGEKGKEKRLVGCTHPGGKGGEFKRNWRRRKDMTRTRKRRR